MTYNAWAKELILNHMENFGETTYHKNEWYCATPAGFLLNVQFEKVRMGFFRIGYNIMPLVAPLNEDYQGIYMSMESDLDAGIDFFSDMGYTLDEWPEFKVKEYESPKTGENCITVLRNYLNPLFSKMDSLHSCCMQGLQRICDGVYASRSPEERHRIAEDLFLKGYSEGAETPSTWPDAPADFPWYGGRIPGFPFVYAALGKYEAASAWLRYLYRSYRMDRPTAALYKAMLNNSREECTGVLDQIYQKNRTAIKNTLGLNLPAQFPELQTMQP